MGESVVEWLDNSTGVVGRNSNDLTRQVFKVLCTELDLRCLKTSSWKQHLSDAKNRSTYTIGLPVNSKNELSRKHQGRISVGVKPKGNEIKISIFMDEQIYKKVKKFGYEENSKYEEKRNNGEPKKVDLSFIADENCLWKISSRLQKLKDLLSESYADSSNILFSTWLDDKLIDDLKHLTIEDFLHGPIKKETKKRIHLDNSISAKEKQKFAMNVISATNETLNSSVYLQKINGVFGLVMESRGGAKSQQNERNTDYFLALDTLLQRLSRSGLDKIRVHVVSSRALEIWTPEERMIEVEGKIDIPLSGVNLKDLRGKISKAQQAKKDNITSKGGNPTKRILLEAELNETSWISIVTGAVATNTPISEGDIERVSIEFSPEDIETTKEKVSRSVALRRGQPKFRKKLLNAYQKACAVTGTSFPPILEAAHIVPYTGIKTNHVTNGILLRADIHTLFDLGLLGINQNYEVVVSSTLKDTVYEDYNGRKIFIPSSSTEKPSLSALKSRPLPRRY